jgi:hypothetical protein
VIVSAFGRYRFVYDLAADDFAALRARMAKQWEPYRLLNGVVRVRSVFKYGAENGLIERAVRFCSEFKVPDRSAIRLTGPRAVRR